MSVRYEVTSVQPGLRGSDGGVVSAPAEQEATLDFVQWWEGKDARPAEAGKGWIGAGPDGLHLTCSFAEAAPYTTATANKEALYLKGSVAEFFVQPDRAVAGQYWEIHVSPNGKMTDIKIGDRDAFLAGAETYEDALKHCSNAQYAAAATDAAWSAEVVVPWATFGLEGPPAAGATWGFSLCRYNYPGKLEDPELSATSRYTKLSYHRVEEFGVMAF